MNNVNLEVGQKVYYVDPRKTYDAQVETFEFLRVGPNPLSGEAEGAQAPLVVRTCRGNEAWIWPRYFEGCVGVGHPGPTCFIRFEDAQAQAERQRTK